MRSSQVLCKRKKLRKNKIIGFNTVMNLYTWRFLHTNIIQSEFWCTFSDIRFWSGYRFENGTFIHYGASYLNISDLSQIPWRNVIKSNWYNMEKCVTLRVSALGVRYDVANRCDYPAVFRSLCQLVDSKYDYTMLLSLTWTFEVFGI